MVTTDARPDIAEVIRRYGPGFLAREGGRVTPVQRKVLASLAACRTAELGGHLWECDRCGSQCVLYNSCGDRHCPQCQARKRADWFEQRRQELLPVEYFHVVFTVPHTLAVLAAAQPRLFYRLLMRAVRETLLDVAAHPRQLGARLGGVMVLHTWGQTLERHPHVHVIVPGGGLSPDGQRWVSCPPGFFLPGKILRTVFRGKLLDLCRQAQARGQWSWRGGLASWADATAFEEFLRAQYRQEWVVHITPPTTDSERVLKYLARYTYRVAIANERIESIEDGQVTFDYKDYAQGGRWRKMTLSAHEFLRRFLFHVLPKGLVRIRTFGFLAGRHRGTLLQRCRELLSAPPPAVATGADPDQLDLPQEGRRCPQCGEGTLSWRGEDVRPSVAELVWRTYFRDGYDSS